MQGKNQSFDIIVLYLFPPDILFFKFVINENMFIN